MTHVDGAWSPTCEPPRTLVSPVRVDPTGRHGPTRGQAAGPRWRQTSHGLYVPAAVSDDLPEQRILECSMMLPPLGAVTGWASLRLMLGNFFDGLERDGRTRRPVPLVAGPGTSRRARATVSWSQDRLSAAEVCMTLGIRHTTAERALFDEMRAQEDVEEAAVAMDMAAAAEITSISRMRAYVDQRPGWDGVPVAREALDLASEDSRSPGESRLRMIWVRVARLPTPLVNREIFDRRGRLLGVADLLDPVAGLVGEFDGGVHAGSRQRSRDAGRDGVFRDHGLEVFRVTGYGLHDPTGVSAQARSARARAKFLPPEQRAWTIEPPPGWEPRPSLDEVLEMRDLRRDEHERWLREGDPDIRSVRGY